MSETSKPAKRGHQLEDFLPFLIGIFIVGGWEIFCRVFKTPSYLFPKPSDITDSLMSNAGLFFMSTFTTLKVALLAFSVACVTGWLLAALMVQSKRLESIFMPYAILLQVTPIVAIAPFIIVMVHDTQWAMVICAGLVALFPILSNTVTGLKSVDPSLAALFSLYKADRKNTLFKLQLPSALPHILGGMRISGGLALIGAIVAEFVAGTGGQSSGLAYQILLSGYMLDMPRMFAALFLIALLGLGIYAALIQLTKSLLRREQFHHF
jgi:NitT/TauT family transport system permease protein